MEEEGRSWPLPSNFVTIRDLRERWLNRRQQEEVEEQPTQRPLLPESPSVRPNVGCKRASGTLWESRVLPESSQRWWSCKEEKGTVNLEEDSLERGDGFSGAGCESEGAPGKVASSMKGEGDRIRGKKEGKFVDNGVAVAAGQGQGPVEGVSGRMGARHESMSKDKNQVDAVEVLSNEADEDEGASAEGIPLTGRARGKSFKSKKKDVVKKNQVKVLKFPAVEAAKHEGVSGEGVPLRMGCHDDFESKRKNVVKRNQADLVEVLSIITAEEETSSESKSKSMLAPLAGDDGLGLPEEAKKKNEQFPKGERKIHKGESMNYVVVGRKENQVESGQEIGDAVSLDLPLEIEGRFSRMFTKDRDRKMRHRGIALKERDAYGKGYNRTVNESEMIWVKKGDGSTNRHLRAS